MVSKKKGGLLLCFVFALFLVNFVSADTSFFVPKDSTYDITFSCELNGGKCSSAAGCNLTITYPNSSILIDDVVATRQTNGLFNVTLNINQTATNGEYTGRASCIEAGLNDTSTFIYEVNPTGIRPSDQKTSALTRSIWFMFGIGVIFAIATMFYQAKLPVRLTLFLFAVIFFLIGLNILSVGLQDEVVNTNLETFIDGFTAVSWYAYYFIFAFLIILWIFTIINTIIIKSNLENARKFGSGEATPGGI